MPEPLTSARSLALTGNGSGPTLAALREFTEAAAEDGWPDDAQPVFTASHDQRSERPVSWKLELRQERRHA